MQRQFIVLGVLLLSTLFFPACGGGGGGAAPAPNFRIHVTDAPFPSDLVESATVVIREIRVREKSTSGWTVAFDGSAEIDLVPLTGGVAALLAEIELEPGVYDEVRLIVDAGEVVLKPEAVVRGDSHTFNVANGGLHFPSGAQTGIKVKLENEIVVVTELTAELTLDFDLSRNFVFNGPMDHAPGLQRIIFTPVVRAVNSSTAGRVEFEALSDNATPGTPGDDVALAGATVTAFDDTGAEVGGSLTDDAGLFSLQLPAGTYTFEISAAGHETVTSADVVVALANLTDLGPVLLAATGGEVTGTVLGDGATDADDADDVVIAGAEVSATLQGEAVAAATVTTDESGTFRFEDLAPGTYDLAIMADGFADGAVLDVVPTAGGTGVAVTLVAHTRTLTGTVVDSGAAAVDGADVVATNAAGVEIGSTTTAADGTYSLVLPTGTHSVRFSDSGTGEEVTHDVTVVGTDPATDQTRDATLTATS